MGGEIIRVVMDFPADFCNDLHPGARLNEMADQNPEFFRKVSGHYREKAIARLMQPGKYRAPV